MDPSGAAQSAAAQVPAPQPPAGQAGALSALARFFLVPVLKSVSYQPPPFRRKPGTDSIFFNAGSRQPGQSTRGASLNFWIASNW